MIEYLPWYHPGAEFLRCAGDGGCGALVVEGDIEVHNRWHEKIEPKPKRMMPVCMDPDCPLTRPGYPPHGPHDTIAGKDRTDAADMSR